MNLVIASVLTILIAYFLGSISPGYFLGKLIKGAKYDLRKETNRKYGGIGVKPVYRVLGFWPAIVTAIFDSGKGILGVYIAMAFHLPVFMIIIAGLFVILGHVFPFYLQFKGGWGAASGLGILLFGIILWIVNGIHVPLYLIILFLAITLILVFSINHAFASSIMLLAFIFLFLFYEPFNLQASLILFSLAFLFLISLFELKLIINKKIKKKNERSTLKRKFLRPLAAVFPLGLLFNLKWIVLIVIGVVFLIFLAMEIIKFLRPKFKYFLLKYKAKEKRRISSMTLFLFSAGLTILIFDKYIAAMVLFFLVFGDLAAWALGKSFGKIKILDKSLEGSIACFLVCALIAFIFFKLFGFSLLIGLIGAFVASLVELSPIQEDNLAVPVITAIIMTFLKMVLII